MPQTPHVETHFTSSERIRDIVIGMSDGLMVPSALAAGLSGIVQSAGVVITAGLAEVAAGAIAMGLGGYLAARTDAEHYASEYAREERETVSAPEVEIFGYVKGMFTVKRPLRSAWQTALVGGLPAAAAFGIAKMIA